MMTDRQGFAGVDWASRSHHVLLTDGEGRKTGEKIFKHDGEGLAEMAAWLMVTSGVAEPGQLHVAIEVPHGPVVETLIERGFAVHAINPKQMDRFRDRFTMAGAKDDSRDAEVMASALRTDPQCFRRLAVVDPAVIELSCGMPCRRPTRRPASTRRRSPSCSSAIASGASTPHTSCRRCASHRCASPWARPRPQAPMLPRSSPASASPTSSSSRPIANSMP
jgi:hypothetical protein